MGCEISVIIPTYNRAAAVRLCLDAFAAQTVSPDRFEIVIVDDGSTDDTDAAARSQPGLDVVYVRQPNAGANAARNRGIDRAKAPLLLFINDDTIATPGLLEAHLAAHAAEPADEVAVLGRMTIHPDHADNPFSPLHHDASFALIAGQDEVAWTSFFTCNVSVKAAFLRAVGRFAEDMRWHEDIELGERLARNGMRLLYRPAALGLHWHGLDTAQYLRIADREADSLVRWLRRRPELAETLAAHGLLAATPSQASLRHRVADAVLGLTGIAVPLGVAERVSRVAPGLSRAIWNKVFQHRKRTAMAAAMEGGEP